MDQRACPGCGKDNDCAVARGTGEVAQCWCMALRLPAGALPLLPAAGAACYCRSCAVRHATAATAAG